MMRLALNLADPRGPPADFCAAKLALSARNVDDAELNRDLDGQRSNRGIWDRLAREARADALSWALALYLAGGR